MLVWGIIAGHYQIGTQRLTRIKRVPRSLLVNSKTNPLGYNLLLSLIDWATTVFRESIVHYQRLWVNVGKEN